MKVKIKKILIALDYNPTAQKVAEVGFTLAKSMGAEVTLLHVMSDPKYYSSMEYSPIMGFNGYINMSKLSLESIVGLKKASQEFLVKTKQHLGDNTIQILIEEGDCAESILKAAKHLHVDVIVMGSHSHRWLENMLMGSVTEKVLRHTTISLLIVPTKRHK